MRNRSENVDERMRYEMKIQSGKKQWKNPGWIDDSTRYEMPRWPSNKGENVI